MGIQMPYHQTKANELLCSLYAWQEAYLQNSRAEYSCAMQQATLDMSLLLPVVSTRSLQPYRKVPS